MVDVGFCTDIASILPQGATKANFPSLTRWARQSREAFICVGVSRLFCRIPLCSSQILIRFGENRIPISESYSFLIHGDAPESSNFSQKFKVYHYRTDGPFFFSLIPSKTLEEKARQYTEFACIQCEFHVP